METKKASSDDHSLTFEMVNDKAELEAALEDLRCLMYSDSVDDLEDHLIETIPTLLELVPRLMASYEEALTLTNTLADAWESYMNNEQLVPKLHDVRTADYQTPAGLYVPGK